MYRQVIPNPEVPLPSTRSRLTYANVVSSLCLFLLLGGGAAYGATHLAKNSVGTKQLKNSAVTSAKIKNNAIVAAKIKNGSVSASKLAANAVKGYFNSGLIGLSVGQHKVVATRGPFRLTASCADAGGGSSTASLTLKNTGTQPAVLESDLNAEYNSPALAPGASREALYTTSSSTPYFFGDTYNLFSAAAPDGTAITGTGSIGNQVLGHACVYQLVLFG